MTYSVPVTYGVPVTYSVTVTYSVPVRLLLCETLSVSHSVQCQCARLNHTAFHHIALCGYSVHTLGFVSIGMSN